MTGHTERFPRVTSDELIALAHRHRTIDVHQQRWSFAQSEEGMTLVPTTGPRYLYRGQTKRHLPCFPSLYRHLRSPARFLWETAPEDAAKIIANAVRTFWYYAELDRHPVFQWAKTERLQLPSLELAQHYGIATALLDLTESIEVALFFATHRLGNGGFEPCTSGTGVLYMIDRTTMPPAFEPRFTPVFVQPFPRPTNQWAWACEMFMGECFEAYPWLGGLTFEHSEALANRIRPMAEAGGPLFPPDDLADIATRINASSVFPFESVDAAAQHMEFAFPKERLGTVHDALVTAGFSISERVPPVLTDARAGELALVTDVTIKTWKVSAASRLEQLYVRGGRDGAPLEYGILTPPAVKGGP